MMQVHFVVPGPLDQRTGGYLYDRRIIAGLRSQGAAVGVHTGSTGRSRPCRRTWRRQPGGRDNYRSSSRDCNETEAAMSDNGDRKFGGREVVAVERPSRRVHKLTEIKRVGLRAADHIPERVRHGSVRSRSKHTRRPPIRSP